MVVLVVLVDVVVGAVGVVSAVVVIGAVVVVFAVVVVGEVVLVASGDEQAATRNKAMRAGIRRRMGANRSEDGSMKMTTCLALIGLGFLALLVLVEDDGDDLGDEAFEEDVPAGETNEGTVRHPTGDNHERHAAKNPGPARRPELARSFVAGRR